MTNEYKIALFVSANQNTAENRTEFATIMASYSGETVENERLAFDYAVRLNTTGDPQNPVQIFGIDFVATGDMRTDLRTFLDGLPQAQIAYYARANTTLPQHFDGELLEVGGGAVDIVGEPPWNTQPFDMQDALAEFAEAGYFVIPDEEI